MSALKLLPAAIGLFWVGMNVQTLVARLTTVAWVHQHHLDPRLERFVANKRA